MTRNVSLPRPDPKVHPVGRDHSGLAARQQRALLESCGLVPTSDLMEIGCGIGRLVYEIGGYLDAGSYYGFDISPAAIAWLDEHYAPSLPNFHFDLVEVHNARYHPKSGADAGGVRFPYDDERFDFACSFSVFTHMQMPDIAHYLHELRRVLRPDGRGVMTFFTIDDRDEAPGLTDRPFVPLGDGVWTTHPDLPERAIAFDDDIIEGVIADAGLTTVEQFAGAWHAWTKNAPLHKDVYVLSPAR
jgi:SAM-dependent methyltransferase